MESWLAIAAVKHGRDCDYFLRYAPKTKLDDDKMPHSPQYFTCRVTLLSGKAQSDGKAAHGRLIRWGKDGCAAMVVSATTGSDR